MPITGWHAARLRNPADFSPKAWRTTNGGTIYGRIKIPASILIIWGKLKGKDKPSDPPLPQSLRFPMAKFTVATAKKFLKDKGIKYILFEPGVKPKTEKQLVFYRAARALREYGVIDPPRLTVKEAFFSLTAVLNAAVKTAFGDDAYVESFSTKEVVIGYERSDQHPVSSWSSGEYQKIGYKVSAKGEVIFTGSPKTVRKVVRYESLTAGELKDLQRLDSRLASLDIKGG